MFDQWCDIQNTERKLRNSRLIQTFAFLVNTTNSGLTCAVWFSEKYYLCLLRALWMTAVALEHAQCQQTVAQSLSSPVTSAKHATCWKCANVWPVVRYSKHGKKVKKLPSYPNICLPCQHDQFRSYMRSMILRKILLVLAPGSLDDGSGPGARTVSADSCTVSFVAGYLCEACYLPKICKCLTSGAIFKTRKES